MTACLSFQNTQVFIKGRCVTNPPAHIAAIRPFLLSWSFKMSLTAADWTKIKKSHCFELIIWVDHTKHHLNQFLLHIYEQDLQRKTAWQHSIPSQDRESDVDLTCSNVHEIKSSFATISSSYDDEDRPSIEQPSIFTQLNQVVRYQNLHPSSTFLRKLNSINNYLPLNDSLRIEFSVV